MRYALLIILGMLLGMLTGGWLLERCSAPERGVEWRVFIDTIRHETPAPVDSQLVRHDIVKLPRYQFRDTTKTVSTEAKHGNTEVTTEAALDSMESDETVVDSVDVIVPITQYEYADSMYHLRVSGYRVTVDELTIYPRREVSIIKQPPRRWHVDVSAGYELTPRGMQPVGAVKLRYTLFSF